MKKGMILFLTLLLMLSVAQAESIEQLDDGLSVVTFTGDDLFDEFLAQGGASSDLAVAGFLTKKLLIGNGGVEILGQSFGCSTLAVPSQNGERLFGRNFDWDADCEALIVLNQPESGYASVCTVNTGFIRAAGVPLSMLSAEMQALIGLYAPLDGMNAKGLGVSVNMISDSATIDQQTDKPDLTTTTAVRLLLDKAATVEEAVDLLNSYDLHASMGMMVHFAIADQTGHAVTVEYIDNEMSVMETPILTNYYLTPGDKYGIGTTQSHERFAVLEALLADKESFSMDDVRDALDSVSKDNFSGYESTEWSIVMNQHTGEVRYYHRENYDQAYVLMLPMED